MNVLLLYTTIGCHLCEQAEQMLLHLQTEVEFDWRPVDIADDDELFERYGIRIPVLKFENRVQELGWLFDYEELKEFVTSQEQG